MSNPHTSKQQRAIFYTVAGAIIAIALVVVLLWYKLQQPVIISDGALKAYGAYIFEQPRLVRDFELIDENGQAFNKEQLKGQWSLVFFGFTQCPDICPTTLSLLKKLKHSLADTEVAEDTRYIMVSVDPARDTPAVLKEYVHYFDPDFRALTGEFLAIHKLATNLNAAFKKVLLEGDEYTIDHTGNIIILNEYGDYQGFFKPPFDVNKLKQAYRSIRYTHKR